MRELETDRLLLRGWRASDLDALAALCADPEVMKFIGDGRPIGRGRCAALLQRIVMHWEDHGFGLWAAQERASGEVLGFVGLAHPEWHPVLAREVEAGWRLARAAWGRGYATEGGRAALHHAFGTLGHARVISLIDPGNEPSRAVARRLGMTVADTTVHPVTARPLEVWEALAPESGRGPDGQTSRSIVAD
jgi:RimJ/RimL family protein N-acetyltransferase